MVQHRLHLNDKFQDIQQLAGVFQDVHCKLMDFGRRVIELRQEQSEGPTICFGCILYQVANVFCGI